MLLVKKQTSPVRVFLQPRYMPQETMVKSQSGEAV